MTEEERRVTIILLNYARGKYSLAHIKGVLARGLKHLETTRFAVDPDFIANLAAIERAIKIIEEKQKETSQ